MCVSGLACWLLCCWHLLRPIVAPPQPSNVSRPWKTGHVGRGSWRSQFMLYIMCCFIFSGIHELTTCHLSGPTICDMQTDPRRPRQPMPCTNAQSKDVVDTTEEHMLTQPALHANLVLLQGRQPLPSLQVLRRLAAHEKRRVEHGHEQLLWRVVTGRIATCLFVVVRCGASGTRQVQMKGRPVMEKGRWLTFDPC